MIPEKEEINENEKGESILKSECDRAIQNLKRNKAIGIDDIPSELISSLEDLVIGKLFFLVSRMYESSEVPSDFQNNTIIPILNKSRADKWE